MADAATLKQIVILTHLNDEMIEKVAKLATVTDVKSGEYLFKEGDFAENLYSVIEGKVALEVEKDTSTSVRIKDIVPTRSFGISSLVDTDEKKCISHAKAVMDSKIVFWKATDLEKLFYEDFKLGFIFMQRITTILKDRLQIKNAQMAQYSQLS